MADGRNDDSDSISVSSLTCHEMISFHDNDDNDDYDDFDENMLIIIM